MTEVVREVALRMFRAAQCHVDEPVRRLCDDAYQALGASFGDADLRGAPREEDCGSKKAFASWEGE